MVAKLNHLFVMTRRTEPATTAAVRQDELMMAIGTFNASESLVEISAFKIFVHYMRDYRAVKSILLLEKFVIGLLKFKKWPLRSFHREVS